LFFNTLIKGIVPTTRNRHWQGKAEAMTEIRMTGELRTDYECEANGMPAERWAEAVFKIGGEEIVLEVSVEKEVIVAIAAGEDAVWKGTLEGLKKLLRNEIKAA
jgi:hypothetical protein